MKVGIIGGAGVAATNKLLELIENELTSRGAFRDYHHPEMIIYQATQAPSRSMFLEGKGPSYIDDYVCVAKRLRQAGADILCMSCNTAHYAIDEIIERSNIPFINLVEETVKSITTLGGITHIGLMACNGCLQGKVYERYFKKYYPEIKLVYPDKEHQKLVTKGICNIKNMHRFDDIHSPERPNHIFREVVTHLKGKGANRVIIGCTDIRVDYYEEENIDSLEILKRKIIEITGMNTHKS